MILGMQSFISQEPLHLDCLVHLLALSIINKYVLSLTLSFFLFFLSLSLSLIFFFFSVFLSLSLLIFLSP